MSLNTVFHFVSFGAVGLFAVYSLVRGVMARKRLTWITLVTTCLAVLTSLLGLGLAGDALPTALYTGLALIGAGVVSMCVEAVRGGLRLNQSPGALGVWAGGLLLAGIVALPPLTHQLSARGLAASSAPQVQIRMATNLRADGATEIAANILISTPVAAATRIAPTATSTPTPFVYVRAAEATEAAPFETETVTCQGRVEMNLNLRRAPTTGSSILVTIPQGSLVNLEVRSEDGPWLRTRYEQHEGWVSAAYVSLDTACTI